MNFLSRLKARFTNSEPSKKVETTTQYTFDNYRIKEVSNYKGTSDSVFFIQVRYVPPMGRFKLWKNLTKADIIDSFPGFETQHENTTGVTSLPDPTNPYDKETYYVCHESIDKSREYLLKLMKYIISQRDANKVVYHQAVYYRPLIPK